MAAEKKGGRAGGKARGSKAVPGTHRKRALLRPVRGARGGERGTRHQLEYVSRSGDRGAATFRVACSNAEQTPAKDPFLQASAGRGVPRALWISRASSILSESPGSGLNVRSAMKRLPLLPLPALGTTPRPQRRRQAGPGAGRPLVAATPRRPWLPSQYVSLLLLMVGSAQRPYGSSLANVVHRWTAGSTAPSVG